MRLARLPGASSLSASHTATYDSYGLTMKQVWENLATWSRTASTTAGAAWPTLTTAMPAPRSISELPSTSTRIPGLLDDGGRPTEPAATAAVRRLEFTWEFGRRGSSVTTDVPTWSSSSGSIGSEAAARAMTPNIGAGRIGRAARTGPAGMSDRPGEEGGPEPGGRGHRGVAVGRWRSRPASRTGTSGGTSAGMVIMPPTSFPSSFHSVYSMLAHLAGLRPPSRTPRP